MFLVIWVCVRVSSSLNSKIKCKLSLISKLFRPKCIFCRNYLLISVIIVQRNLTLCCSFRIWNWGESNKCKYSSGNARWTRNCKSFLRFSEYIGFAFCISQDEVNFNSKAYAVVTVSNTHFRLKWQVKNQNNFETFETKMLHCITIFRRSL